MAVEIWRLEDQAKGEFNDGEIMENKPIGFPQDNGYLKPYSNLFYWANATSQDGGLIAEHPHKGFEIMSFVLKGSIEHYDSYHLKWKKLFPGDVQIIRSGSGISHAERLNPATQIFQIWFDPNLEKTMHSAASYDDYNADVFPVVTMDNYVYRIFKGKSSPVNMESEGVEIVEYFLNEGEHIFNINNDKILSIYIIGGDLKINDNKVNANDFVRVTNEKRIIVKADDSARIFTIYTPVRLKHKTYRELFS